MNEGVRRRSRELIATTNGTQECFKVCGPGRESENEERISSPFERTTRRLPHILRQ